MGLFEIGRLCLKIAGRDANKRCVVVDVLGANTVLVDGETRRRSCNVRHLEPLGQMLSIQKGASREDVATAFRTFGVELPERKPRKAGERPRARRKQKEAPVEVKPAKAKVVKKKATKE